VRGGRRLRCNPGYSKMAEILAVKCESENRASVNLMAGPTPVQPRVARLPHPPIASRVPGDRAPAKAHRQAILFSD
jgi:hypothetical protein